MEMTSVWRRSLLCLGLVLAGCARPTDAQYEQALSQVDQLMAFSHDRETAGRKLKERGDPAAACPNFRAAQIRAEAAAGIMKRLRQPERPWDEAHGWSARRSQVFAQQEAMRGQIKETCTD